MPIQIIDTRDTSATVYQPPLAPVKKTVTPYIKPVETTPKLTTYDYNPGQIQNYEGVQYIQGENGQWYLYTAPKPIPINEKPISITPKAATLDPLTGLITQIKDNDMSTINSGLVINSPVNRSLEDEHFKDLGYNPGQIQTIQGKKYIQGEDGTWKEYTEPVPLTKEEVIFNAATGLNPIHTTSGIAIKDPNTGIISTYKDYGKPISSYDPATQIPGSNYTQPETGVTTPTVTDPINTPNTSDTGTVAITTVGGVVTSFVELLTGIFKPKSGTNVEDKQTLTGNDTENLTTEIAPIFKSKLFIYVVLAVVGVFVFKKVFES